MKSCACTSPEPGRSSWPGEAHECTGARGGVVMDFYAVLDHVVALLQQRGRVTYNALKLQFSLDDEQLAVLKDELLYAHPQVVEDAGRGLRWTGDMPATQAP